VTPKFSISDPLETYSTDLLNGMWIARSSVLVALEGSLHGNANSSQVPAAQKQRLTKPQKLSPDISSKPEIPTNWFSL
jgi:hypothetical protein